MSKPSASLALILAASLIGCADVEAPPAKQVIIPQALQQVYDEFQYAPAVRAGDMLYLSGVVVRQADGETLPAAIVRGFDQIDLILSEAGASWSDVVDVTSYMTDLDNQVGPMWAEKGKRITAPHPAWTAIGVKNLYGGPDALIEIKVTAYLPKG